MTATSLARALRPRSLDWVWAATGALVMWLVLGLFARSLSLGSLVATGTTASFLAIVALGQMIVVTTGRGAIDLSIPGVISLAAYLATGLSGGRDASLLWVIPLVLAVGAAVGLANAAAVLLLRIPPIIATLGVGYVVTTLVLVYNPHYRATYVAPILTHVVRDRLFGVVPVVLLVAVALVAACGWTLRATRFGRSLLALGQNLEAARLAGVDVNLVQAAAYALSGILAAFGGILISARAGGAFLGLGDPYLLETVASVVVGGTLIFGGKAVPLGTLFGSLFLVLLVTAMQVAGMRLGGQYVAEGLLIILVLAAAGKRKVS